MKNEEALIEAMIIRALSAYGAFVFKVPNDALWVRRVIGAVAGAPDLVVVTPDGVVGFIEVKTRLGRLSIDQKKVHAWLSKRNARLRICRSVDDAISFYKELSSLCYTTKNNLNTFKQTN